MNLVGERSEIFGAEEGSRRLAARSPRTDLRPHPDLPDDTRLWAALVQASGGVWGGCVYDVDKIIAKLEKRVVKLYRTDKGYFVEQSGKYYRVAGYFLGRAGRA